MCTRKILVVSEIFYPEGGGAELATYLILKILKQHGFRITVVTGTRKPFIIPGVQYFYMPLLKNSNRITRWSCMKILSQQQWFTKLLKQHDTLYVPLAGYPLIPLAKEMGLRVIVHLHNYMPVRYYGVKYFFEDDVVNNPYRELKMSIWHEIHVHNSVRRAILTPLSYTMYRFSRYWIEEADHIICVSKRQAEIFTKTLPKVTGKVKVIHNPLPPLPRIEKKLSDKEIVLLYVGGRSYLKGYHILLKALIKLSKIMPKSRKLRVVMTGNSFTQKKLMEIANIRIEVLGKVARETLMNLHRIAHALVFPSIWEEPLPYAVLESTLLETIPIASRMGGILEILDKNFNNLLFKPNSSEDLACKLVRLVDMKIEDRHEIRKKLKECLLGKFSKAYEDIIEVFKLD